VHRQPGEGRQELARPLEGASHVELRDARQLRGVTAHLHEPVLAKIHAIDQLAARDQQQRERDQCEDARDEAHTKMPGKFMRGRLS
jgi:hypothetical protein